MINSLARMRPLWIPALMAVSSPAVAQNARTVTLTKPTAELSEPFTSVLSIRELSDGRVLTSDSQDKLVQIADFKAQSLVKSGRDGKGPGEYNFPQRLYALKSDSTLLYDIGLGRYLLFLPNGKPGATREAADVPGYRTELIGLDNFGRVYFKASRSGAVPGATRVILRFNTTTRKVDSITTLAEPVGENIMARTMPGGMLKVSTNLPYVPRDVATVAPDGSVIVARVADYHLEWFAPDGKRTVGTVNAYTPIAINTQEKRSFMERQMRPGAIVTRANPNATSKAMPREPAGSPGANSADLYDDKGMTWPANIPPFLDGALSVDGAGRVWVKRTVPHNDSMPSYDVFDATAKRVLSVRLPAKTKLVGFGRSSVYLVRIDDDDLQHLQRYAAP